MSAFHADKKPWAKIKHGILQHYLPLFVNKLAAVPRPIRLIDGFAGAGRYEDGQPGSALICAEIATNSLTATSRGRLCCINVEKNAKAFASLEEATRNHVALGRVQNIKGEFEKELPAILQSIQGDTALFFIDPFGTGGATIQNLERIGKRLGITEVLLRFDSNRVKRLLAFNRKAAVGLDDKAARTEEKFRDRVRQLTSMRGITAALSNDPQATRIIVEGYMEEVTKDLNLYKYGLAYPVVNPNTGGHKYYLVHFCNHPDGYAFMANFMAEMQRTIDRGVTGDPFGLFESTSKTSDIDGQMAMFTDLAPPDPAAVRKEVLKTDPSKVSQILRRLPDILRQHDLLGHTIERRWIYAAVVDEFKWTVLLKETKSALSAAQPQFLTLLPGTKESSEVRVHQTIS